MQPETYRLMAEVEEVHWWFRARRDILAATLEKLHLGQNAKILEAGCGTGGNLAMLDHFGKLHAFEPDPEARTVAQSKHVITIEAGGLPDGVPENFKDLDLICAFDVLEHIDDDHAAATALFERLRDGGGLVVTVPAFAWLWSRHDDAVQHKRRYTRKRLVTVLQNAGFEIARCSYFNTLLFPLVAVIRLGRRLLRIEGDGTQEMALPGRLVNRLLYDLFGFERQLLARFDLPFGVSLLAVAHRPHARQSGHGPDQSSDLRS